MKISAPNSKQTPFEGTEVEDVDVIVNFSSKLAASGVYCSSLKENVHPYGDVLFEDGIDLSSYNEVQVLYCPLMDYTTFK
jgi:hypothetical protein